MSEQGSQGGRVVWHDLMTTDIDRAAEFYTQLFGWQLNDVDMGGGTYKMIRSGETDIGGLMPVEESHGVPSHWTAYVTVDDVDAAVQRANAQGGETLVPTTPIPNVGAFAVIKDPKGACISPFKSDHPDTPESDAPPPAGQFCWDELLTTDPDGAARFYGELFGWTDEPMDMGETGIYHVMKRGERFGGGIMKMPPQAEAPPHWLSYVAVEDVDQWAGKVTELGGQIFCPPTDIPNIGRFAVAADPTGGMFAIFKGTTQG
ncbi:MAG: VOC family protein [Planctomycetota bacterium]|jgi:predicted enzyme related to lactoylglutathione lyase